MAKTRIIFLSDIHLSSKTLYDDLEHPAWYSPEKHEDRLVGFLKDYVLAKKDDIKDVVLLGDVFNTWVCPADVRPPTYANIITSNGPVVSKLKEIIGSGINLFYINGNHDFDLRPREIQQRIEGIRPIRYYRSGRTHAEHGHQYDIYNRPDFISDPGFGRPIGYFISRLMASGDEGGFSLLDLPAYLDDVLEAAFTSQNIFQSIIEAVAERANMRDDSKITMPRGIKITVSEVKQRYGGLSEVYSKRELLSDLYGRRYLHGPADRICARNDFNTVIFGHTHNALIDKDWFLVEDRIYANGGAWCKDRAYCVEIERSDDPDVPKKVSLLRISDDGTVAERTTEELE